MSEKSCIYKSPEFEARLMAIYDARLAQWPVPYQSVFVDTTYGKVHVIASGPEQAPPVLLLHYGGMSASMWLHNIEGLSRYYRTYAIDHIGEAGKSALNDLDAYPRDSKALSDLYAEIADRLGIAESYVIGASNGGFIGMSYALYAPQRVKALALLGPAGLALPPVRMFLNFLLLALFPTQRFKRHLRRRSLGQHPTVLETCDEWVRLMMDGVKPKTATPKGFPPDQFENLRIPLLLILGERDNVIGAPERVKRRVQNLPQVQIEVIDAGHLMAIERPDAVNARMLEFFERAA